MFQSLDEFEECFVQGRRHPDLFSPVNDRAIHEIDFGLPLREDILQHAGAMLAGRIRTFLH